MTITLIVFAIAEILIVLLLAEYLEIVYSRRKYKRFIRQRAAQVGVEERTPMETSAAPAAALDDFASQLLEGVQEIVDFVEKLKTHAPELAEHVDAAAAISLEGIAELDAQLRRQGSSVEERRAQLFERYFANILALSPKYIKEIHTARRAMGSTDFPSKLEMFLMGDMTPGEIMRKRFYWKILAVRRMVGGELRTNERRRI